MRRTSRQINTGSFAFGTPTPEDFPSMYPRPAVPTLSLFQNAPTAEILVGPERIPFHVHSNVLVAESAYFKAALTSGFKERDTKTVSLPEDEAGVVEFFVQWCYTRSPAFSVIVEQKLMELVQLYHFADSRIIPRLRNDIIWELFSIRQGQHTLPIACVEYAFTNLPRNCHILPLLAAWFAWHPKSAKQLTRPDLETLPSFSAELNIQYTARNHNAESDPFSKNPNVFYEKLSTDYDMTSKGLSDGEGIALSFSVKSDEPLEPELHASQGT